MRAREGTHQRHAVALIELGDSHVECIFSQLLFLHQMGCVVHLVCSEGMREQVSAFAHVHRFVFLDKGAGVVGHWRCVRTVLRYLKENAIGTVIFNTGSGNHTRDISLFAPRGVHLVGLIHHTHKLKGSFTQKLISLRVRRCFVLNDYLLDAVPPSRRKVFTSVYLIFREPVRAVDVRKEPGTLWVAIPGQVDFRRRDYRALVEELQRWGEVRSLRFFVLGECKHEGDGGTLRAMLRKARLEQQVTLFDRFVDRETFFGYVSQCDLLLPLIHPSTHFFSHYARFQISGTYNLAFGHAKPLLLHSALKGPEDFEIAAHFYKDGELLKLLEHFAAHRDEFQEIGKRIREASKFSFAVQCDRYMRFLKR
jgi:hypothetical protein